MCLTFISFLDQGFCAREKLVLLSWLSLNPQKIFFGKVSFCQVFTRPPSSVMRDWEMEEWRADKRSVEVKKHCHALMREPYSGPWEEEKSKTQK